MKICRTVDLLRNEFRGHIPLAVLCLTWVLHAGSESPPPLMQKYDCLSCHRVDSKLVGPAFQDVAKRYTMADLSTLVKKVKTGGSGNWGAIPMIPHPSVPDADIQKLVTWILSLNPHSVGSVAPAQRPKLQRRCHLKKSKSIPGCLKSARPFTGVIARLAMELPETGKAGRPNT